MNAKAFVVTPMSRPQELNVVGEHITVLASGAATGGYEIFLQEGPEASGPPPHSHPWDESFYVVKGRIEFGIGADKLVAGTTHWFRFGEGGGQMISMTSRLGASEMFSDIDREISPTQPDLERLIGVGARHGLAVAL